MMRLSFNLSILALVFALGKFSYFGNDGFGVFVAGLGGYHVSLDDSESGSLSMKLSDTPYLDELQRDPRIAYPQANKRDKGVKEMKTINLLKNVKPTSQRLKKHYDSPFWRKVRKQAGLDSRSQFVTMGLLSGQSCRVC